MNQHTIAIDCDEVLCETAEALLAYHNFQFNGQPLQKEQINTYALHQLDGYDATLDDSIDYFDRFFEDTEARATIQPVAGARERVAERKQQGHELVVVTARWSKCRDFTQDWLETHFPGLFSDLIFADHFSDNHIDKSVICKRLGASHLIEDNLSYAQEAKEAGINAYLLHKPWNNHYDEQKHDGIVKVNDWNELELEI